LQSPEAAKVEAALVESARGAADQNDLDADRQVCAQMTASQALLRSLSGRVSETTAYRRNPKAQSLDSTVDRSGFGEPLVIAQPELSSAASARGSQAHRLVVDTDVEDFDTDSRDGEVSDDAVSEQSSPHSSCLDEAVLSD
jgi:hypothetical protein